MHPEDAHPLPTLQRTRPATHATAGPGTPNPSPVYPEHLRPNPRRRQVAERLTLAGRRHTRHHHEHTGTTRQPGPHAVLFFYHQPLAGPRDAIGVATRLFLNGDDVTNLPTILTLLWQRAQEFRQLGTFDPRQVLATHTDPSITSGEYVGVGTSTLHPPSPHGDDGDNRAWSGLARLIDGTHLSITRPAGAAARVTVTTTHTLDTGATFQLNPTYTWRWASQHTNPDPARARAVEALDRLHQLLLDSQR